MTSEKARLAELQALQSWALKSEDARRLNAMLELARSEPGIPVCPADLDRDPWLFNCPNGTLELRTGTLREHRRGDLITKLCPTPYEPDAPCPTWQRFLAEIFAAERGPDRELIGYVQRLFGYALTGDVSEHLLAVFHGSGANGKGVLVNTILDVVGEDYAMAAMPSLLLTHRGERHPTEIASLFGKRLLVCQETGAGRRLNEPLVKWLTGGDKLQARRMREDFWEFAPTHKAILVTNHRPEVQGSDDGIWRRLQLVPFNVHFWDPAKGEKGPPHLQVNKRLGELLKAEAEGILAWCVRGTLEWFHDGMQAPPSVLLATQTYRAEEDVVGTFIAERCLVGADHECRADELYRAFRAWQEEMGETQILKQKKFGDAMTAHEFKRRSSNGTWYIGICLNR
jgi:putative DNA primase/helicase